MRFSVSWTIAIFHLQRQYNWNLKHYNVLDSEAFIKAGFKNKIQWYILSPAYYNEG